MPTKSGQRRWPISSQKSLNLSLKKKKTANQFGWPANFFGWLIKNKTVSENFNVKITLLHLGYFSLDLHVSIWATPLCPHLTRSLLKHFSGESYFSIKFSPLELRISKKKKSHGQRSRWPNPIFLVLFKRKNLTTKKKLPIFFVG